MRRKVDEMGCAVWINAGCKGVGCGSALWGAGKEEEKMWRRPRRKGCEAVEMKCERPKTKPQKDVLYIVAVGPAF